MADPFGGFPLVLVARQYEWKGYKYIRKPGVPVNTPLGGLGRFFLFCETARLVIGKGKMDGKAALGWLRSV